MSEARIKRNLLIISKYHNHSTLFLEFLADNSPGFLHIKNVKNKSETIVIEMNEHSLDHQWLIDCMNYINLNS